MGFLMRKDVLTIGVILLIVGVICTVFPLVIPIEDVDSFTVSALTTHPVHCHLKKGDKVEGYFTVSGGANDDIPFWVENPLGSRVVNPGRVYSYHKFSFVAHMEGDYCLYFDNTISLVSSKAISLTLKLYAIGKFLPLIAFGVSLTVISPVFSIAGAIMKPKTVRKEAIETHIFCRYCGTKNIQGANYCRKCGKKIGEESSS